MNCFCKFAGAALIVVGIIGLFVPVLPGIVLIIAGLAMIYGRKAATDMVRKWKNKGRGMRGL